MNDTTDMWQRTPRVSVITPVYNASKFLPRLFKCISSQTETSLEHILVDDCSTDDSLHVMTNLAKGRSFIKVVHLSKNQGPVFARNVAISQARGKYLAFLDADDFWLPEKLDIQWRFMEEHGIALSFTDYRFISECGHLIGRRLKGPNRIGWTLHHTTRYLGCLTMMINRERCKDFAFPDISPAYRAEDFLAWSKVILQQGPALRCGHDLARYAVVSNSRSSGAIRAAGSVWRLYRRIEQIPVIQSFVYFSIYGFLTMLKRWWFSPRWASREIDQEFALTYLLEARSE